MKDNQMSNNMNYKHLAAGLLLALGMVGAASADTLFSDSFQGDLSQWNSNTGGVIVADPLVSGGSALAFARSIGGGDLFAGATVTSSTSDTFILSYDYLGIGAGGGYVGINRDGGETWLAGDGSFPTDNSNPDTGTWQHVSFQFTQAGAITLKLEQWDGQNQTPMQAYFKNLVLTDANGVTAVPEPESYAMLLAGLGLLGFMRRRKAKQA